MAPELGGSKITFNEGAVLELPRGLEGHGRLEVFEVGAVPCFFVSGGGGGTTVWLVLRGNQKEPVAIFGCPISRK